MIGAKRVLAVIPARGGSKGVSRKNIRIVAGKPLIAWTIEEARKSKYIDRVIVSSEDSEIIEVAKRWGGDVPFVRPAELAKDDTPGIAPVLHALGELPDYDYVVLLQTTSPLRSSTDIDSCIESCFKSDVSACVSVTEVDKSPYWMYIVDQLGRLQPLIKTPVKYLRRQELPSVYVLNGAVYVAEVAWLHEHKNFVEEETIAYLMPKERSLDLDTEEDFLMLDCRLKAARQ